MFDCIRIGETYDARLEKPGWDAPDYDDTAWRAAQIVTGPAGALRAQMLVKEGAVRAATALQVKFLRAETGELLYEIGSGTYHFEVPMP